jgi:arylsulfatase A-like enzyme
MTQKPNIVLIMVDDMGYSDLGCCGGEIQTPNLNNLADNGIIFTHFYNTARCCPARASLLTGLYPHQAGMGWMTAANLGSKGYSGDLDSDCRTIAEVLKPEGYSTYMSGKWHLTYDQFTSPEGPKHSWPCQRGFDRFYGTTKGGGSYYNPPSLTLNNDATSPGEDFYYTDAITNHACQFISDHANKTVLDPFFLYTAYTAPHWPLHAREQDISKYRGRFNRGWDVMREERYHRMVEKKLIDPFWKLSERDEDVPAWASLSQEEKDVFDLRMAIYAAQVEVMDRGVGEIIDSLKFHNMLNNTLILFLSDNGGCHEEIHRMNQDPSSFGTDESFESYGRGWANVSNTPFRLFKSWVHEGGISTPLIAHWPNGIAAKGELNSQPGHITDIMPTCLELANAKYNTGHSERIPDLVGSSLVPYFDGNNHERGPIFWEHEGNRALRHGEWKIVAKGVDGLWELYNIKADRSELNNLAKQHPDIVEDLSTEWAKIASNTHVMPLDGRGWNERIQNSL